MTWWAALFALLALGCDGPSFDRPSLVQSTRLIAVVAEPPEAAPGADVDLEALVVGPGADAVTVTYAIDLSPRALAAAAGQDLFEPAEPTALEGGHLEGARTQEAIDALMTALGDAEPGTAQAVVRQVYREVGLVAIVTVEVRDAEGTLIIEGFKRIGLFEGPGTQNPPPPRFSVDGSWASGVRRCEPEAAPLRAAVAAETILSPDPDESWLETYPAIDLAGRTGQGTEAAYYSWFSTAGDFSSDVTRVPDADVRWVAPSEPGLYPLWLVVRDGHLGTSACRADVEVR